MKTVVELGCNDGGLAIQCLRDVTSFFRWTGYDFSERYLNNQTLHHERYKAVLLDKWLWEHKDHPRFHTFIASHAFEHLYPDEAEKLVAWLEEKCTHSAIIIAPTPEHVVREHVLGKSIQWIVDLFDRHGFRLVWRVGRFFGWFTKK